MPTCTRCHEWTPNLMSVKVETCPVCDGSLQKDEAYVDIFSTPLLVVGAALTASAVAGVVAGSIGAFRVSVVGGILLGFAWYGIPDHLGTMRRRWPRTWRGVAVFGGPVVAFAVAALVLAGLGLLVLAASAIAFVLWIASYWGPFSRYEREVRRLRDRPSLDRDARLARLARRYEAGELTSAEYDGIATDIRRRY